MRSTLTLPLPLANSIWPLLVLASTLTLTLGVLLAFGSEQALLLLAGLVAIPVCLLSLRYPQWVVALILFLLFSNAPVVAVRFHGLPKALGMIAPVAVLLAVCLYQLVVQRASIVFPRALPWVLAFIAIEVLSALFCRYPDEAKSILQTHLIEGLGLLVVLCSVIRTRAYLHRAIVALLLAGACLGGLSLWQQATGTHHHDYGGFAQVPMEGKGFLTSDLRRQRRAAGSLGEQNRYAQNLLMLVPLAVLPTFTLRGWQQKMGYGGAALLISAGCVLTFSRGAALAFVMLLGVMKLTGYIRARHLAGLCLASALFLMAFPQLLTRMDSVGKLVAMLSGNKAAQNQEVDGAITGRATSMLAALRVAADYPLLGVGPGNFRLYNREYAKVGGFKAHEENRQAHCLYLQFAAESGLPGLGVFLAMTGSTLMALRRVWKANRLTDPTLASLAAGFAMALFAYLLTALFLHFSFIRFFWIIFALACSVPLIAAREANERIVEPAGEGVHE